MERYEKYKDSGIEWIGDIPEGWEVANLGPLVIQRKHLNTENEESNVLSLSHGRIVQREIDNTGLMPESFSTYNIIEAGDIVLRLTDLQNDQRSLRVGHSDQRGIITAAYTTLIPFSITSKFGFYALAAFDYWKGFYGLAGGVRQSLTFDGIRNLRFPLPNSLEQQAIADYLDEKTAEIDGLVAGCEREVELLQEYRKAVISEAVTKGLDPNAPMKDSGIEWIGQIPERWEVNKLRFCGTTQNGISKGGEFFGSGFPFVSYGNVYRDELDKPELFGLIESTEDERARYGIARGDVLFTRTSETIEEVGVASSALTDIGDCCFAGFVIRFRPSIGWGLLPEFSAYYFRSDLYRPYLTKEMVLVTRASMSQQLLGGIAVLLPPAEDQQAIVDYLDTKTAEIDSLIEAKQAMVDKLREYRKSLISEAVTGKFKVPGV